MVSDVEDSPPKEEYSSIPETFKGKTVLITGATGFVGKVLLEKLLRSCTGISEILILMRPGKDGCTKRFEKLKNNTVFDAVRTICPINLEKMRCVTGDVISGNLGVDEQDLQKITKEVSFVFHCAATVRFDDDPKTMFGINLEGVKNVLDVCRSMKKLEAFVHVSTAYSFCNRSIISETIYKENPGPDQILQVTKWMNEEQLRTFCKTVVKGRPSLYHFSKAMAEIYLAENHKNLPVIIVRPSIVTASFRDPFPGWIDNHNGPSGFIALSSKGVIRTLLVEEGVSADLVPVDVVANTLIVAAHVIAKEKRTEQTVLLRSQPSGIPIVNCVCPEQHTTTWTNVIQTCVPFVNKYPSISFYRTPGKGTVTSSRALHTLCKYVYHYIPAAIIDVFLCLFMQRLRLIRTYRRIHGVMEHLQHYTTHRFLFFSNNMKTLVQEMSFADKTIFPIDQNEINWETYMEDYVHGVRKYYLKEKDQNLCEARRSLVLYKRFWKCLKITTAGFLLMFLNRRYLKIRGQDIYNFLNASKYHFK